MRTASRLKNNKHISKREFIMDDRKTAGTANTAETLGIEPGNFHIDTSSLPLASSGVTNEERRQLIAEAAYFRAERRSFTPGYELEDWLNAEAEVDIRLIELGKNGLPKNP
jgi:hypothetical protein